MYNWAAGKALGLWAALVLPRGDVEVAVGLNMFMFRRQDIQILKPLAYGYLNPGEPMMTLPREKVASYGSQT